MPRRLLISGAVALCTCSASLTAQSLRDAVNQLFTFGTCGQPLCLDLTPDPVSGVSHGNHFIPALETSGGTVISFLTSAIGSSVSNTPVSSSSGGTTFEFRGGVPVQTSTSAGPIFGQRAQTLGRGRWFMGFGVTQATYRRLRGVSLSDIEFNFTHENRPPTDTLGVPGFERDFIHMNLDMEVNLLVAAVSATYGLSDHIDVGVTVPFVRTSLSGTSTADLFLVDDPHVLHRFGGDSANPILNASSSAFGVASGLGDVEGTVKVRLSQREHVGFAVVGTARFATGDDQNLLGGGAFSGRALGIMSARLGTFNPHGYFGYTVRSGGLQANSVEANLGFDDLLAPWWTMAVDVLGSWQSGASKIDVPGPVTYNAPFVYSLDVTNIPSRRDNVLNAAVGFKFRTKRGIQIVGNALVPLKISGLQPTVTWTAGMEYNF
jgi:hypothetical protein